jgi:hypothetical protein
MFGTSLPPAEVARRLIGHIDASDLSGTSPNTNELMVSRYNEAPAPISSTTEAKSPNEAIPSEVLILNMLSSWDWDESTRDIISLANEYGHTLAHICATSNFEELLSYLICCGIDLTKTDNQRQTAADFAAFFGNSSISQLIQSASRSSPTRSKCALYRLLRIFMIYILHRTTPNSPGIETLREMAQRWYISATPVAMDGMLFHRCR